MGDPSGPEVSPPDPRRPIMATYHTYDPTNDNVFAMTGWHVQVDNQAAYDAAQAYARSLEPSAGTFDEVVFVLFQRAVWRNDPVALGHVRDLFDDLDVATQGPE